MNTQKKGIEMKVKAEHEDKIYPVREFICRLQRIQDEQFENLLKELREDGFPEDERSADRLFDYCYNSDIDEEVVCFEEFCDFEFMRKYRIKKRRK